MKNIELVKPLFLLLFIVVPIVAHGGSLSGPVMCSAVPAKLGLKAYSQEAESVTILDFVKYVLNLDVEARSSILNYNYPEDMKSSVHDIIFNEISALGYEESVKCILSKYIAGDKVLKYSVKSELGVETGYALLRAGNVIAILVIEQKLV